MDPDEKIEQRKYCVINIYFFEGVKFRWLIFVQHERFCEDLNKWSKGDEA